MDINFSPLRTGHSAALAAAESQAVPDSVDAFLLLMGAAPDAGALVPVQNPADPEIVQNSAIPTEEDDAAVAETVSEPLLSTDAQTLFPYMSMFFGTGLGTPNFASVTGGDQLPAANSALGDAALPAQQIVPAVMVQAASLTSAEPVVFPDTPPQAQKAVGVPIPATLLASATATAPDDLPSTPATALQVPAGMTGTDAARPRTIPPVGKTLEPTLLSTTLPPDLMETNALPAAAALLPPMARAFGYAPPLLQAIAESAPQPGQVQSIPGFVVVGPRMPDQDIAVPDDTLPVETAGSATLSAAKTDEGRRTTALAMHENDSVPYLAPDTSATQPVDMLAEPSLFASDAGPGALHGVTGHQSPDIGIERAAAMATVRLSDLAATINRTAASEAPQTTTLQLDPIELGTVAFNMDTGPSGLIVTITAERPETLDLLRRNAEQFLGDLRQSGFLGASLQFSQSGTGHSAQQDQPAHRYPQGAGDQAHTASPTFEPASQTRRQMTGQTLDLRL